MKLRYAPLGGRRLSQAAQSVGLNFYYVDKGVLDKAIDMLVAGGR